MLQPQIRGGVRQRLCDGRRGQGRHWRLAHFLQRGAPTPEPGPSLIAALRQANGLDPLDLATGLVPLLLANSLDRTVIWPIGRIEVAGPILRAGREGPHTHLLPEFLAHKRELEPGFALPEGYYGRSQHLSDGNAISLRCARIVIADARWSPGFRRPPRTTPDMSTDYSAAA